MCRCQLPLRHLAGRREVLGEGKDRAHLPRGRRLAGQQTLSSPRPLLPLARPSPRSTSLADAECSSSPASHLLPVCSRAAAELSPPGRLGPLHPAFPALKPGEVRVVRGQPRSLPQHLPSTRPRAKGTDVPRGCTQFPAGPLYSPGASFWACQHPAAGSWLREREGGIAPGAMSEQGGCWVRFGQGGEE